MGYSITLIVPFMRKVGGLLNNSHSPFHEEGWWVTQ